MKVLAYCGIGLVASILGELAAGVWRVPVDLVPRRHTATFDVLDMTALTDWWPRPDIL